MNVDNIVDIDVVSDETARKVYEQIKNLTISQPGDTTEYIDEESKKLIQGYIKSKTKQLNDYYANVADADLPDFMRQYRGAQILSEIDLSISNVNNILSHFKPKDDGKSIADEFKEAKDHLFELESRLYGMGLAPSALQKKAIERIKNGNMEPIDIDDVFEFKNVGSLSLDEKISEYRKTNRELWKNIKIKNDRSSTDINSAIEMINRLREYSDELEKTIPADSIKEEREIKNDISAFNQARADYLLEKETYKARTLSREQGHSEEELNDKELARSKKNMEDLYSKLDNHYNVIVDNTNDNDYKNREAGGNNMGENGGQFEFKDVNSLSLDESIEEYKRVLFSKVKYFEKFKDLFLDKIKNEYIPFAKEVTSEETVISRRERKFYDKFSEEFVRLAREYGGSYEENEYIRHLETHIGHLGSSLANDSSEKVETIKKLNPLYDLSNNLSDDIFKRYESFFGYLGNLSDAIDDLVEEDYGKFYHDIEEDFDYVFGNNYNVLKEKIEKGTLGFELDSDVVDNIDSYYDEVINWMYDNYDKENPRYLFDLLEDTDDIKNKLDYICKYKYNKPFGDKFWVPKINYDEDSFDDIVHKTVEHFANRYLERNKDINYNRINNPDKFDPILVKEEKDKLRKQQEAFLKTCYDLNWLDLRFKLAGLGDMILNDGDYTKITNFVNSMIGSPEVLRLINDKRDYDDPYIQAGLLKIKLTYVDQLRKKFKEDGNEDKFNEYDEMYNNFYDELNNLYDNYQANPDRYENDGSAAENNKGDDVKFNYSTFEYDGVTYYVGNDLNKDNILSIATPLKEAVMVNSLKPGENTIGDLPIIINMDENGQITVTKKGKELNVNNFNVLEENNSFDYLKFTSNGVDYYVSNNLNDDNISDIVKSGKNTPCMVSGLKDGKNYIEGVDAVITLENGKLSIEGKGIENVSNNTYEDVKYVSKEAKKQVKKQNARGKNNPKDNPKDKDKGNNPKGNVLAADRVVNETKPKKKLLEKLKNSKIGRRIVAGLVAIGTLSAGAAYLVSQLKNEHVNQDITQTQEVNNDYQKPSDSVDSNKDKGNTDEKSTTISYNTADLSNLPVYDDAYDATSRQNPLQANQWFRYNPVAAYDTQTRQFMNLTQDQLKDPEVLSKLLDGHHAILCGDDINHPSGYISVEDVYQSLNAESQAALDEAVSQANNTMHR